MTVMVLGKLGIIVSHSPKIDRSHSLKPVALLEIKCGAMGVVDLTREGIFPTLLNDSRLNYVSGVKTEIRLRSSL